MKRGRDDVGLHARPLGLRAVNTPLGGKPAGRILPTRAAKAVKPAPKAAQPPAPAPRLFRAPLAAAQREREHLRLRLRRMEADTPVLEQQVEHYIVGGEEQVAETDALAAQALAAADQQYAALCADLETLRDRQQAAADREAAAGEREVLNMATRQRLLDDDIPSARAAVEEVDARIARHAAEYDALHAAAQAVAAEVAEAQGSTYGLTEEAAEVVRQTEAAVEAASRLRDRAMASEMDRRRLYNLYEELKGCIRVYCRVKGGDAPTARLAFPDPDRRLLEVSQTRSNATSTGTREATTDFRYDYVFDSAASQEDVFAEVGPLVDCAVDGYKVCIMAYGQTGSGKTFTMEGGGGCPGVTPRGIDKVFSRAAKLEEEGWEYTVTCTFVEIYNDLIRNLLDPSEAYHRAFIEGGKDLAKRHDVIHTGRTDTTVTNVKERRVSCPADVHRLLETASANRSTAKTLMNERSSRSHCVFTMRIEGTNAKLRQRSVGGLCLVDLAGSERVNDSGVQGQQLKEAIAINRSLMHLGDCINSLGSHTVVSWRNCKLTYLLQNYLGGEGSKMLMFVNVSNKEEHVPETLNSLRFAAKVNATHIGTATKRVLDL